MLSVRSAVDPLTGQSGARKRADANFLAQRVTLIARAKADVLEDVWFTPNAAGGREKERFPLPYLTIVVSSYICTSNAL